MDWQKKTAKDIMRKKVVAVRPNILIQELAQILDDNGISGAPVINHSGSLVGVVSKTDLVHYQRGGEGSPDKYAYYRDSSPSNLPQGYHVEAPDRTQISEIMTPAIIQAEEDTPVTELVRLMRSKHIHRIFVTKGKKLLGVVTTMDLLKLMEGTAAATSSP